MNFEKMSHFKQRVAVSLVAIVFLLVSITFSFKPFFKPFFALIVAGVVGLAVWEYCQIARSKGLDPLNRLAITFSTFYILALAWSMHYGWLSVVPQIVLALAMLCFFLYFFIKGNDPFINLATSVFSVAYLTIPLGCIISINYFFAADGSQDGRWWVLYLIAVTKMTDIGGYFFGKKLGHTRLAPYISPQKTWEGTIGGLVMAIAMSFFFYLLMGLFFETRPIQLTFWQSLVMGVLIGIFAQLGDLSESLLKRDGGVKDSSHLPGLGGVLDIVDSLVFTAPLVYIFLQMQR